jgi:excinuclease UvrABC ATPase subunit
MQVGSWFWREITAIDLFDVHKKLKDFTEAELNKLLYTEPIPINKKHGSGTYSKTFEGIARKLEKGVSGKAEDEAPDEEKNAYKKYIIYSDCIYCKGTRLNERALSVKINGVSIAELCEIELSEVLQFLKSIKDDIAFPVKRKAQFLIEQLIEIGVGYLSLNRSVATLSGGESQRVKMARQLDCNLVDMLYVLDEPSIGLHPKDIVKLLSMLKRLRDNGNSVFVVEHDPEIIRAAEWIVDIGPKAGTNGGQLIYSGNPLGIGKSNSVTGEFLCRNEKTSVKRKQAKEFIAIENANVNNLKNVSVNIPLGLFTCITGVAGSGKSSLIHQVFLKQYPDSIVIDQSAIGKSSRANPATYTGIFDLIRKEFAKYTGADASLFCFNSKGACPKCNGHGLLSFDLHFLDAFKTRCDECEGKRYKPDVLELKFHGKSIADILDMSVDEAYKFFSSAKITRQLKVLQDVGLGYVKIGQSLSSLSGGESQRLKIASELHKVGSIYVMDEPTTGLHMSDILRLYNIIRSLADKNNTVIVIEHNLDIIKYADWIIDLGPEGGRQGGKVLFQGIPEDLVNCNNSHTAVYLKKVI